MQFMILIILFNVFMCITTDNMKLTDKEIDRLEERIANLERGNAVCEGDKKE